MFVKLTGYTTWANLNNIDGIEFAKDDKHEGFYYIALLFGGQRYVIDKSANKERLEAKLQKILENLSVINLPLTR